MAKSSKVAKLLDAAEAAQAPLPVPEGFKVKRTGMSPLQKAGDVVQGVYEGEGSERTVKGKKIATYLVKREDGATVQLLATFQLADFFKDVEPGTEVFVRLDGQVKGGQFGRVNTYTCAVRE